MTKSEFLKQLNITEQAFLDMFTDVQFTANGFSFKCDNPLCMLEDERHTYSFEEAIEAIKNPRRRIKVFVVQVDMSKGFPPGFKFPFGEAGANQTYEQT